MPSISSPVTHFISCVPCRDGSVLSAGSAIPVPLTALSGVAADLATQSLIFVPQEHVPTSATQAPLVESVLPSGPVTPLRSSAADIHDNGSSHSSDVGNEETSVDVTPRSAESSAPPVFSLILPGASASSDTDGVPTLVDRGESVGGLDSLSPQSSSVAFSTWLDARREEREMEREIDRLRAMLRNREQEYEEAIRSILSLEGGQVGSTSPVPALVTSDSIAGASVQNSAPDSDALSSSGDRVNSTISYMRNSSHIDNFSSSSNSDSDTNGNSSDSNLRGPSASASASVGAALDPPSTPPAVTEITDTDETSVATPSTAAGSDNSVSTDTGIATATTQVGSREEDDRLTAANSSNSGSRASSVIADSNTQISLSTYSDGAESSEEVFPSTVLLGSSSLDSDTSSSSGSGSDSHSSFRFDLRAAHEPARAASNTMSAAATSGSTEGEGDAEAESAYAGYDHEKDFESLSSGSISGETIDAYIASKDGKETQQPRGMQMDGLNAKTAVEADAAVSASMQKKELFPSRTTAAVKSDNTALTNKWNAGQVSSVSASPSVLTPSLSGSTIPLSSSSTASSASVLNISRSRASDRSATIPHPGPSHSFHNTQAISSNREVGSSAQGPGPGSSAASGSLQTESESVPESTFQREEKDEEELEEEGQLKLRDQIGDKPR
jgi:trimeric autotransporter adhesin